jgi:saccharopine dehydrogenase (NAD+, L-lysine-forming)
MRIVAIGASGNAGRAISNLLAPGLAAGDELVLAGRNTERLDRARSEITADAKVSTAVVDVADTAGIRALVAGADLVIVTASRPDLVGSLAREVLDAGADWFDTLLSSPAKLAALRALEPEITAAGRCFVTDGGFHPGLPAVLVRWAAEQLDEVVEGDVMGGMRIDWQADTVAESTIEEMLEEFTHFDLSAWIDGERRAVRWAECPTVDFGEPIGRKLTVPMPLAEMDELPVRYPSLRRCGFYICGFGPAMDFLVLPILMVMGRIRWLRRPAIRLTRWSMRRLASSPPPHRLVVQTEVVGQRSGRVATASAKVSGVDGYLLTAAPAVACLRRVLDGETRIPGLHLQAHLVPPGPFLADLAVFGLNVETSVVTAG